MDRKLAYRDFRCQLQGAKRRSIKFQLSFEEWVAWWEAQLGSDWQGSRGKSKGKYVMARKGDKGPYSLSNITCILASQNVHDAQRGERSYKSRITDAVALALFQAPGTNKEVATRFGVSIGVVNGIKRKKHFRHITASLIHPKRLKGRRGDNHPCTKITDADVVKIRTSKLSAHVLARKHGVNVGHIYDIKNNLKRRGVVG